MENPETIPIVDVGPVLHNPDDNTKWTRTVKDLDTALSTIGFVYLKNHGIPALTLQKAFSVAAQYFHLSPDIKALYTKKFSSLRHNKEGDTADDDVAPGDYNGYVPAGDELLGRSSVHEIRESFDIMGASEGRIFPSQDHVRNFQQVVESLREQFISLALKLGQALGVALLGAENMDFFRDRLRALVKDSCVPGLNQLRLLYYPEISAGSAVDGGGGVTRCFEHSDYCMFTFLAQNGVGGLEVKHVSGNWIPAPPVDGAVLLNTGDLLQFWSDGHYPATRHRVWIPTEPYNDVIHAPTRQSIAFFVNPDDHVNVTPLKTKFSSSWGAGLSIVDKEQKQQLEEINALEYVMQKLKTAYGN